jgi:DNA-binding winged helix-turn-helix (wHTH) protein
MTVPPDTNVTGYAFEDFEVDLRQRQLRRHGALVPVSVRAFDLLVLLVRRAGVLVEKDELLAEAWPDTRVSEDNLKQTVSLLRRALNEDPEHPRFIATVPRHGYRFVAPVHPLRTATTPPPRSSPPSP